MHSLELQKKKKAKKKKKKKRQLNDRQSFLNWFSEIYRRHFDEGYQFRLHASTHVHTLIDITYLESISTSTSV